MIVDMDTLQIKLPHGYLVATKSTDPNYPGIDVEYIDDNDNGEELSRPRVLIEAPTEWDGAIRALIWNNSNNEDYEEEIELYNPIYKKGDC